MIQRCVRLGFLLMWDRDKNEKIALTLDRTGARDQVVLLQCWATRPMATALPSAPTARIQPGVFLEVTRENKGWIQRGPRPSKANTASWTRGSPENARTFCKICRLHYRQGMEALSVASRSGEQDKHTRIACKKFLARGQEPHGQLEKLWLVVDCRGSKEPYHCTGRTSIASLPKRFA